MVNEYSVVVVSISTAMPFPSGSPVLVSGRSAPSSKSGEQAERKASNNNMYGKRCFMSYFFK